VQPQPPTGRQHGKMPTGKHVCVHAGLHEPRICIVGEGSVVPLPPEPPLPAALDPLLPAVPASVIVASPGSGSTGLGAAQRVHSVAR
jgi:hypothetical protein